MIQLLLNLPLRSLTNDLCHHIYVITPMQMQEDSSRNFLGKYWKSLRRQWKIATIVFAGGVIVAVVASSLQKSIYTATGKLSFRRATTSELTGFGKEVSEFKPLQEQNSPLDTEAELIRSEPIATKIITSLKLKDAKEKQLALKDFTKRLKVSTIKGTDIIQLSYDDPNPNTAATVVNKVMSVYLEESAGAYQKIAVEALKFIEKQSLMAEKEVQKHELELRRFRENNSVISLEEEQKGSVQLLLTLKNELKTAQAQLSDTKAQLSILQSRLGLDPERAVDSTAISQSKGIQDLLSEKQKLESQLAIERTRYRDSHPTIEGLNRRLKALNNLFKERISLVNNRQIEGLVASTETSSTLYQQLTGQIVQLEAKQSGLASQVRNLLDLEKSYQPRSESFPELEQQQRELTRRLNAAQTNYTLLINKVGELRVAVAQSTSNSSILARALVPTEPSAPSRMLFLLASIAFSSFLAIAVAIILDAMDKSIRTIEDALQAFDFPILAVIPFIDAATDRNMLASSTSGSLVPISKEVQSSQINRACHLISTKLRFLNARQPSKIITVASVEPQEGKSTVAANLASVLVEFGAKVVLVDANLHSPSQSQIWHVNTVLGLSNVLLQSAKLDLVLVNPIPNLALLPAGSPTNNPLALLNSANMEALLHSLSDTYDYIILDTPDIRSNLDALILGKLSDGMLLVTRPGFSTLDSASFIKEAVHQSGLTIFGQVINGIRHKHENDKIEVLSIAKVSDR